MSLLQTKYICNNVVLGIWKMDEPIEDLYNRIRLSDDDKKLLDSWSLDKRKKEWLCSRILAKELLGEEVSISHDEFDKPIIVNCSKSISITHSKDLAAIIIGSDCKVGIDIEFISDRVEKIKHKFMSESEQLALDPIHRNKHMLLHWCAKESLMKIYGKKDLEFITEIPISPFVFSNEGTFHGKIITADYNHDFVLNYIVQEDYMVVWSHD